MEISNKTDCLDVCIISIHNFLEKDGGGEERFLNNFSTFLESKEVKVTIISAAAKSNTQKISGVRIKPFQLPFIGITPYLLIFSFAAALKIISINKTQSFALIHAMDTGYAGLAGVFSSKILHVPLIVHSHCKRSYLVKLTILSRNKLSSSVIPLYEGFERSIDKLVCVNADKIITVSEEIKGYLGSLNVLLNKIIVIPVGVNLTSFESKQADREAVRREFGIDANAFVVGYVGTLSKPKGVPVLVDAFLLFQNRTNTDVHLLLVGNGELKSCIEETLREKNLRSVMTPGFRKDVARLLAAMDVFVLPSLLEGCPYSLLEALAAGKAIIANDIPSIQEIVQNGLDAVLVTPNDPNMLEQAIASLYSDPLLKDRLSKNAKRKATMYDVNTASNKIFRLYNDQVSTKIRKASE